MSTSFDDDLVDLEQSPMIVPMSNFRRQTRIILHGKPCAHFIQRLPKAENVGLYGTGSSRPFAGPFFGWPPVAPFHGDHPSTAVSQPFSTRVEHRKTP